MTTLALLSIEAIHKFIPLSFFAIPIFIYFCFRKTIARLPNVVGEYEQGKKYISISFLTLIGTVITAIVSLGIYEGSKDVQPISSLKEISDFKGQEYFLLENGVTGFELDDPFYFSRKVWSKYGDKFYLNYYSGGIYKEQPSSKSIYLFSIGSFYYGKEYDSLKEYEMTKVAKKKIPKKFEKFLNEGGIIKKLNIEHRLVIDQNIRGQNDDMWRNASNYYMLAQNPSSLSGLIIFFTLVFGAFMCIPIYQALTSKLNREVINELEKEKSFFQRLFNSRFRLS
ncbi:hypothetical protein C1E23_18090 [Pseudoalteromonas phenolica]|uniref:Uncharacterized protein n=1 Tax=Pseudoalteromonas phenolica TaxID=161398 RepID=A0A4Q7IJQ7_9GAMM|nr:hypothetical protein [Pseudoalteromonas phenolica]RZQ51639.1 hypothetical protein C1E23_18090 [Pseudoalteromonas phenolica]